MVELEKTYLAKYLPNLDNCKFKEIIDIYIPKDEVHPFIRLRKNGEKFELTKKEPVDGKDSSEQIEQTIILTEKEFEEFKKVGGKFLRKIRYYLNYNGKETEIDVFQDLLKGLVLVDFEFETIEEKNSFEMPDFCLADVTQELFAAGGIVAGKKYEDLEPELKKYGYKRIL